MKQKNYLKLIIVTVFFALCYTKSTAQTGTISGVITDDNGLYVPGANVYIESIKKGTVTDFNGRFALVQVPIGNQDLKITYLGYADIMETVEVIEGKNTVLKFVMNTDNNVLEEVTISTSIGGEAKALNKQKSNLNITNVISTDQIGKFPDANIGDAIKRIPGITMQLDQGEARNVIVRGLSPQLNSVTLNGSRIPSAEGDNRNVQMDLIPSDMIQSIEVNKAVTPDMDADALGGSVNLVTRTAPQNFRLSATAGSGLNFINDKRILNGSLLIGDRSKNGKFGWMISASVNDSDFGSDNFEADWDNKFEYNTGVQDTDGEDILEEVDVNPYAKEFQIRKYLVQRTRRSFSANLDYQLNSNNHLYFKSMYNWRDDRENRFRLKQEIKDGEDIAADEFTITNNNLVSFPVDVKRETKGGINNSRNENRRLEDQRMQNADSTGTHSKLVRKFGKFSGKKEIEAIAVDNELGYVYYSDEQHCIRKYHAEPSASSEEIACFGGDKFLEDIEGIAIAKTDDNNGYIIVSNQQLGEFNIFDRQTNEFIKAVNLTTTETDGCDVVTVPLGAKFPNGLFVAMNDNKEFYFYDLKKIIE